MLWHSLKIGGVWGIPRNGVILEKTATGFNVRDVMPYTIEMEAEAKRGADVPKSAAELLAYQRQDFACIQRHMEAAGLEVTDTKALLIERHVTTTDLQREATKSALKCGIIKSN